MAPKCIFAQDIISAVSVEECQRLSELANGKTVLEMGSEEGRSTIAMATTAKMVHSVDWHLGDVSAGTKNSAENFIRNIVRYGVRSKIVMHMGRFSDVVPLFKPNLFQLIFLDGCHTREAVMADIDMAKPLLAAGATMAFHDYSSTFPGVIYCVEKFAASMGAKVEVIQTLAVVKLSG